MAICHFSGILWDETAFCFLFSFATRILLFPSLAPLAVRTRHSGPSSQPPTHEDSSYRKTSTEPAVLAEQIPTPSAAQQSFAVVGSLVRTTDNNQPTASYPSLNNKEPSLNRQLLAAICSDKSQRRHFQHLFPPSGAQRQSSAVLGHTPATPSRQKLLLRTPAPAYVQVSVALQACNPPVFCHFSLPASRQTTSVPFQLDPSQSAFAPTALLSLCTVATPAQRVIRLPPLRALHTISFSAEGPCSRRAAGPKQSGGEWIAKGNDTAAQGWRHPYFPEPQHTISVPTGLLLASSLSPYRSLPLLSPQYPRFDRVGDKKGAHEDFAAMMSPRSFLVSRQNHFTRSSPSSSPVQSPSQSPRASPQHSPSHSPSRSPTASSPLTRPPTKPSTKPAASSPFAVLSRRRDDTAAWDSIPSNNFVPPSRTTTAAPAATNTITSSLSATTMGASIATPPRGGTMVDVRRLAKADAPVMPFTPPKSTGTSQTTTAFLPDERPTTPTSPVQIPVKAARHETAHPHAHAHTTKHRHHQPKNNKDSWRGFRQGPAPPTWGSDPRRRARDVHSPDSISPSVAALLAVTTIPRSRSSRSLRQTRNGSGERLSEKRMTVNSIINRAQEVEQEFSFSLSKSPLDVLLTAPEDLEDDDDVSISDSTLESMPSLADSFATGTISSYDSPRTPYRGHGGVRKARPTRRSMTPVSSPPGVHESHESDPLSAASMNGDSDSEADVDNLDFRVFQSPSPDPLAKTIEARFPLQPLRSAFKSNLTASLRALRNAARSFSNLNLTSIPPEDFLTRSILTIDPRIPYTDERRPPPLEEEPSPALRRYLNPTTGPHIDLRLSAAQMLSPAIASASLSPVSLPTATSVSYGLALAPSSPATNGSGSTSPGSSPPRASPFTASIQMQTYRVHNTKGQASRSSSSSQSSTPQASGRHTPLLESDRPPPGPRQRELRENSDFIRIAVMEMAMRRAGKLDDRKPGRARLALPPRKMGGKPYVVGTDGVPARWISVAPASD